MVVCTGDAGSTYVPAGSFTTYNNDFSSIGNPSNDTQCSYYLRSQNRTGARFTYTYGGIGMPCLAAGSGRATNYVYDGDPSNPAEWSECGCLNTPGNMHFIVSTNDFDLSAGSTEHFVCALVVADSAGGCPVASFNKIRIVADTAWGVYHHPPPPSGIRSVTDAAGPTLYPNPAHDRLIIENNCNAVGEESIAIYNAMGQVMSIPITKHGLKREADIGALPVGLYYLRYTNEMGQQSIKFLKE
jgi:hypothetical protein